MVSRNYATIVVVGAALLLRLAALLLYPEVRQIRTFVTGGDARAYEQLAENLLSSGSFGFAVGSPTAFRMPGYPMILAATGGLWGAPLPIQILQIVADLLTLLVVIQIGRCLSTNPRTPLLAAIVVAVHPLMLVSAIALYPETIAILLMSLGTLLLLRFPDSTGAGVAAASVLSASIYLKPNLAIVAIVSLSIFVVRRLLDRSKLKRGKATALLPFFVVALLLMPWIVRNLLVMRAFIPLTTGFGLNLYAGNNPQSDGGYVFSGPYVLPHMSERESDHEFSGRAMDWIESNPAEFAKLLPSKAARFLWPLSLGTSGYISVPASVFVVVLSITLAFYGLALFGAWGLIAAGRLPETALLLAPFVCVFLTSLLTFGAARFSLPSIPTLAVLASLGVERLTAQK